MAHYVLKTTEDRLAVFAANWQEDGRGCWIWQGWSNGSGYATIRAEDGKPEAACRFAMRVLGTGIPVKPFEAGHTCHVRMCVNPMHLRPVTRSQNRIEQNPLCRNGHPFIYLRLRRDGTVRQRACGKCSTPRPSWVLADPAAARTHKEEK